MQKCFQYSVKSNRCDVLDVLASSTEHQCVLVLSGTINWVAAQHIFIIVQHPVQFCTPSLTCPKLLPCGCSSTLLEAAASLSGLPKQFPMSAADVLGTGESFGEADGLLFPLSFFFLGPR